MYESMSKTDLVSTHNRYYIALVNGHTTGLPYISDTGAKAPEAPFFSFCLNVVAVLFAMMTYVRYKQIDQYCIELGLNPIVSKRTK